MHLLAFFFFPIFGCGFAFYFLPAIIAFVRNKRDAGAILLLNFFLGWTMLGWVVALVWALKQDVLGWGAEIRAAKSNRWGAGR